MTGPTVHRLANGARLVCDPVPGFETLALSVVAGRGARSEDASRSGWSHLLEHMVFKRSTKHTNIPQELTEHGTRPNGTTSWDRTNYFETFSATDENLKWALDLESDRMINSFIKKEDLDKEFSVVRNEFESGENNPTSVLFQHTMAAAYLGAIPLWLFMPPAALMMFSFGLMIANFTALAMEPQGHIAGTASSLYGSITTLLGIGIGTIIGQDYNGTLLPFATGFFICALAALAIVALTEKGRLFVPHHRS